jgi:hypothetical protein
LDQEWVEGDGAFCSLGWGSATPFENVRYTNGSRWWAKVTC